MIIFVLMSVSTREQGSRATCHLTNFNETLPVCQSKRQSGFCFGFFRGDIEYMKLSLRWYLTNYSENRILLHPQLMCDASISQFGRRLVNQQWQINDCVFRLFDSSKYLTTLRSTISPCQRGVTLILIPLYNPSSYL